MEDVTVEGILYALADPVRVSIFREIAGSASALACSNFLKVKEKPIPKSSLSQHFRALREAGLIRSERVGVQLRNASRCAELNRRFPGLIRAIVNAHKVQGKARVGASDASKGGYSLRRPSLQRTPKK
jgi:DNA-binding transcriptional ArsR family regulator